MFCTTIKGERVTLRPGTVADAAALVALLDDAEVRDFLGTQDAISLEAEVEWLRARQTDPNTRGWIIEFRSRPIGVIGLDAINWELSFGTLGAWIGDKALWNQGLMKEAGQLARDFFFMKFNLRKIKGGYIDGNDASKRAQERAGFREVGRFRDEHFRNGQWRDHVAMELWREDWERLRQQG